MFKLRRRPAVLTLLAGAFLMSDPPRARADFQLMLSTGSDTVIVNDNGQGDLSTAANKIIYSGSIDGLTVSFDTDVTGTVSSNFLSSQLKITELSITNNGPGAATLTISLTDTSVTMPVGSPLTLASAVGGSYTTTGPSDTLTFQSYADVNNQLYGTTASTGAQTFNISNGGLDPSSYSNTASPISFNRPFDPNTMAFVPFSFTNVTTFNLSAGASVNIAGTTTVTGAGSGGLTFTAPAPGGLALACAGLPVLFAGAWRRRRSERA